MRGLGLGGVLVAALAAVGVVHAGELDAPGAVKAMVCAACHGPAGNSPSDAVPSLAGMRAAYFKKAIEDYAAGRRPSPEMEPFAKQVKVLGVDEVAGYFAAQPKPPSRAPADRAAVDRGRAAATRCATCHGPEGKGDPARNVPDLTGQRAGYLRNQMLLFKTDKRSPGDPALKELKAVMREVPDAALADLAAYYSSLR